MEHRQQGRGQQRLLGATGPSPTPTTVPSPPRFHLHPAQAEPPPAKHAWASGSTAAQGAMDLEGRVVQIARPLHSPPPLLRGSAAGGQRTQAREWARVVKAISRAKREDGSRCFLNLPHTVVLAGAGGPNGCWAFTSSKHGVVLRKREANAADLGHLQHEFLRVAAASARPRLRLPRPGRGHEGFSAGSGLLPPGGALAQADVEPEAVVALVQGESGGSSQRPLDALELLHLCQTAAFPPAARTLQAYVPEKGASLGTANPGTSTTSSNSNSSVGGGGGGGLSLVPGSTFHHEYSLSRLGAPLHRSFRCVPRSLFGGGQQLLQSPERATRVATTPAVGGIATAVDDEEGEAPQQSRGSIRLVPAPELELLPSLNRTLNHAMQAAAQQVVLHVEGASGGGRVQRLVCEFFLDEADKLWLRRTLDCQVLLPPPPPSSPTTPDKGPARGHGSQSPRRRPARQRGGFQQQQEENDDDDEEDREEEKAQDGRDGKRNDTPPPPSMMVLPGHRIEERVGRRAAQREVVVDEARVAQILQGRGRMI